MTDVRASKRSKLEGTAPVPTAIANQDDQAMTDPATAAPQEVLKHTCQFCDGRFRSRNALFKHLRTTADCFAAASKASGQAGKTFEAPTIKMPKQKVVLRFGYHTTSYTSNTTKLIVEGVEESGANNNNNVDSIDRDSQEEDNDTPSASLKLPPNEMAARYIKQVFFTALEKHHPYQEEAEHESKGATERMTQTSAAKHRHLCLTQDWDCSASSDFIGVYYKGHVVEDFGPVMRDMQQRLDDIVNTEDSASIPLESMKVLDARVLPLSANFQGEKSCTQRVYHYLLPLDWLEGGHEAKAWWEQQGGQQQYYAMRRNRHEHQPRSSVAKRPEVLNKLKRALKSLESNNLKGKEGSQEDRQQQGASPGRFGALWIKERRCWHNFADPALRGMASPSNDPVWRAVDKAKVLKITGDDNSTAVIEIRGDGFVTQQVRRMMGAVIAMTNGWLPLDYVELATRSDICLETPLAPAGKFYFVGGRFHYLELTQSKAIAGLFKEREPGPEEWQEELQSSMIQKGSKDDILQEEQAWLENLKNVVAPRIQCQLTKVANEDRLRKERTVAIMRKTASTSSFDHVFTKGPGPYQESVSLLREIVKNQKWPRTSKARSRVIRSVDASATDEPDYSQQHGAAAFDGERFQSGSFTVLNIDLVDGNLPLGNELFPELAKAVFDLEAELANVSPAVAQGAHRPDGVRRSSTHCAVNRNAEFVPHVDSGRGAGQSVSMIVGLGDYAGGEIFVEGHSHGIRYIPLEFDGWKQRHWTAPFEGERYSLVWFTPAGNENNTFSEIGSEEYRKAQQLVQEHQKRLPSFPLLEYRTNSTDALVINEIFDAEKGCTYELKNHAWEGTDFQHDFCLQGHACVLDIGAHIGVFSRFALAAGCKKTIAYEPEPSNLELLALNLKRSDGATQDVTIHSAAVAHGVSGHAQLVHARTRGDGSKNTWRHALEDYSQYTDKSTTLPSSKQEGILTRTKVATVPFYGGALIPGVTFVKLDCEGAEIDILLADEAREAESWMDVTHLVFEWSFTKEKRLPKFRQVICNLKDAGFRVAYDGQGAWWDTEDPQAMWPFHNDLVVFAMRHAKMTAAAAPGGSFNDGTRFIKPLTKLQSVADCAYYAEPLIWCGFLTVAMAACHNDHDDNSKAEISSIQRVCLAVLSILTLRSFSLFAGYRHSDKSRRQWRQPPKWIRGGHPGCDAPGIFMGILLVPLLCLALGQTLEDTAADGHDATKVCYYYVILTAIFSWVAWEASIHQHGTVLYALLVVGVVLLALVVQDEGHSIIIVCYAKVWHAIYYGLHRVAKHAFYKVFTQGEWMMVTSMLSLAGCHYVFLHTISLLQPNHTSVAMSGVLAAVLTCPIMSLIKKSFLDKIMRRLNKHNSGKQQQLTSNNHTNDLLTLGLQLPLWFGIPLLGVELSQFVGSPSPASYCDLLDQSVLVPSWMIPKSLHWLVTFLLETEQPLTTSTSTSTSLSLPLIPRYGWIAYWSVVLAITIPLSPAPCPPQVPPPSSSNDRRGDTVVDNNSNHRKIISDGQTIVLARKWFHLIAILLFGPVTLAAPQLLSLSYAIALTILILFESARSDLPMIQQFHERYLDPSKDVPAGLVISHMALIVGCATPLWISEVVMAGSGSQTSDWAVHQPASLLLLQLWGVLSLGVGDAMGAVVGVFFGKTQWSRHNGRTVEGSLAMWASMMGVCLLLHYVVGEGHHTSSSPSTISFFWQCLVTVSFVTLLEAHTFQVDNLVLPLAGVALLLLLQS